MLLYGFNEILRVYPFGEIKEMYFIALILRLWLGLLSNLFTDADVIDSARMINKGALVRSIYDYCIDL